MLQEKARLPLTYNSDCRGESIFRPLVNGEALAQPQIPTTLPTYDELIGREGISPSNYNDHILSLLRSDRLNVLTIHAEVEGGACLDLFRDFLAQAGAHGIRFVPLGHLLPETAPGAACRIVAGEVPGRDGWVAIQEHASTR